MSTLLPIAFGLLVVAFIGLAIHPVTRPYALRFLWAFAAVGAGLVGAMLAGGKGRDDEEDTALVDFKDHAKAEEAKHKAEAQARAQGSLDAYHAEAEKIEHMSSAKERREEWARVGKGL